jgi:hypothetical protein
VALGEVKPRPRSPAMTRSMTAQARVRQEVSPGKRPIALVRLRTSSSDRSSRFVWSLRRLHFYTGQDATHASACLR